MLVMAVFIGGVVNAISSGIVEQDNREIAADTCGVTIHIMQASDESFLLNMVNSAQYEVDCLGESFGLEKKDEEGKWQEVTVKTPAILDISYNLPSGQNRSFLFCPVDENGNSVLMDGEYRITKDIHREMGSDDSTYADLTLKAEFSYPDILSETRSYEKPVQDALTAEKLARTLLPEQAGMVDYWEAKVEETDSVDGVETKEAAGEKWWKVTFEAEDGVKDAQGNPIAGWVMYVAKSNGNVYGPVIYSLPFMEE